MNGPWLQLLEVVATAKVNARHRHFASSDATVVCRHGLHMVVVTQAVLRA